MDEMHWLFWSSQELQILYHDRVSLIVSRFSVFIKKCVIRCCHVTESFCAKWSFARALPARSPRNLGSLADLAVAVFGNEWRYCVCPMPLLLEVLNLIHEKCVRMLPILLPRDYLRTPTTPGDLASGCPLPVGCPNFDLVFGFLERSRRLPDTFSSLRRLAGLEQVLHESCGNEVEDELAPELDNPGTTRSSTFSVLHCVLFPSLARCGFWSLSHT